MMLSVSYSFSAMPFGDLSEVTVDDGEISIRYPEYNDDMEVISMSEVARFSVSDASEIANGIKVVVAALKAAPERG